MTRAAAAALLVLVPLAMLQGCAGAPAGPPDTQVTNQQAKLLLSRAEGYFFNRRYAEAISGYTDLLAVDPENAVAFRCRAAAHAALGQDGEALADYGRAVEIDPRYEEAWVGRGLFLYAKGRYGEAIDDFDRALAIDSRNGTANLYKALACERIGRLREAAEARAAYIHCEVPREVGQGREAEAPARELDVLGLLR